MDLTLGETLHTWKCRYLAWYLEPGYSMVSPEDPTRIQLPGCTKDNWDTRPASKCLILRISG